MEDNEEEIPIVACPEDEPLLRDIVDRISRGEEINEQLLDEILQCPACQARLVATWKSRGDGA